MCSLHFYMPTKLNSQHTYSII
uniref:Uncharacterized protein n=1 Tax=Anguilla anguilla TaxID=7936 RepID=A0A0E9QB85_ANGAN